VLDLGDAINPAYTALNSLLGQSQFPTNVSIVVPFAYESRLRVAQPLFDPAIVYAHAAARATSEAASLDARAVARRIAADAQSAWLDAASARRARTVWESALGLVTESERVAGRLVSAGRATPDVVFRARADRADVEQRLAEARDAEDAAARAFNQILRRPLDATVDSIPDSSLLFALPASEDEAVARAIAGREELRGAEAGARAAGAAVRIAGAAFLPRVAVALDHGYQGPGVTFDRARDFTVGSLIVSWDVFNGGRDVARRQAATADAERARLRVHEARELAELDVRRAYRSAVVARGAIATADARVAAARSSHALVQRRFTEGLASQVELLDARNTLTDAELNRVITAYRYARRYVELERATAARTID
jgi:outer membrane protein TolC